MPCAKGCTFTVHAHQDHPDDPVYPIVVCPFCMTRWNGHRDDREQKPLDPRIPPAFRDAILLDQAERAFEILEHDLGYSKALRPNGIIGASDFIPIEPTQSLQITARPQCDEFTPTHFISWFLGVQRSLDA